MRDVNPLISLAIQKQEGIKRKRQGGRLHDTHVMDCISWLSGRTSELQGLTSIKVQEEATSRGIWLGSVSGPLLLSRAAQVVSSQLTQS